MTAAPRVTVLMPVYNAAAFLHEAIDSILSQTFTDFEFLIIDDGSTDNSAAIVRSYPDPRIRFIQNERNLKLTATLNRGLDLARGDYIARMDADDISLPERLARQVAFLDTHPDVGIVGVWARAFGESHFNIPHPADPERIRAKLLFDSALVHPSVLMRRSLLNAHSLRYEPLGHFEDYELWQHAARLFPLANISEYLFCYRVTTGSAFFGAAWENQREVYARIDQAALPFLGIEPTPSELDIHTYLRRPEGSLRTEAEAWLLKLAEANRRTDYYDQAAFAEMLHERWMLACYQTAGQSAARWLRYARSPLTHQARLPLRMWVRMLGKFLLQRLR
ncbi:MAG: glycosyltransferase family 2 protein [Janthinobacterium lividum]